MLHLHAESTVKTRLGYNVEQATYVEYYPTVDRGLWEHGITRAGRIFHLRQRPVTSISSLYEDLDAYFAQASSAFASTDQLTEGTDYIFPLDHDADNDNTVDASLTGKVIHLNNKGWPTAPGSIKVTYVAGWTQANIPKDIKQAVLITIVNWWSRIATSGTSGRIVTQERLGDYSVSYLTDNEVLELPIPPQAEALLQRWKRTRL